jgi:hypothetical protein
MKDAALDGLSLAIRPSENSTQESRNEHPVTSIGSGQSRGFALRD